jgi:N6-adenosine-specific RNA methylase IME4
MSRRGAFVFEVNMEFHKYADIFPLMNGAEFDELVEDIRNNGLLEDIMIYEGAILDGRNRYNACAKAEVEPIWDEYTGDDPLGYVISKNLHRRHLTGDQLCIVSEKAYEIRSIDAKERQLSTLKKGDKIPDSATLRERDKGKTSEFVAKEFGISPRKIEQAKRVKAQAPDLYEKVEKQELTFNRAEKELKKRIRKKDIEDQKDKIKTLINPSELYDCVVIDPPWQYSESKNDYDPEGRRVASPYPEMNFEEIMNIKVPSKDDCILWLWTTHKYLPKAFELLTHWGFEYKATLVWNKKKMGIGHWLRMQCEFCLLGIKGNPLWDNTSERDIIEESRREHSRKPDTFYEMVSNLCLGFKLDYFAREKHEGFDSYGVL